MPRWLELLAFRSNRNGDELLAGVEMLRELNRSGRRNVPGDAPTSFVPKGWLPFVHSAEDKVSRRFWELALLWRLRVDGELAPQAAVSRRSSARRRCDESTMPGSSRES